MFWVDNDNKDVNMKVTIKLSFSMGRREVETWKRINK